MARFMPSDCSDRVASGVLLQLRRRHRRLPWRACSNWWLGLGTLVLLGLTPAATASLEPRARGWIRWVFPVSRFVGFTSGFGLRVHPLSGVLRSHDGLDIAAPLGSPVRSWWSGRIDEVILDSGCGNGLVIRSGDYEHIYCHLGGSAAGGLYRSGAVVLAAGDRVAAGQVIGHVGVSGASTGPHLHWGLRYRGAWLDPVRVLRAMAASRNNDRPRLERPFKVEVFR